MSAPRVSELSDLTLIHLSAAMEEELRRRAKRRQLRHTPTPASEKAKPHAYEQDTVAFLAQFSDQEAAYRAALAMEKRDMEFAAGTRRGPNERRPEARHRSGT